MLRYGGVIVADSVGMGKTYIALKMIGDALVRDWDVTVFVPATLRRKWRTALASIGNGGARDVNDAMRRVMLTSHSLIARLPVSASGRERLVVVDEAHQFRNPATARYRSLARLAARAHVLLLTATPINNRPADLYWLLRLFLGDGALAGAGVPDLRAALLKPAVDDDELMRRAARATIVRRTREDYMKSADPRDDRLRFPRRHAPRAVPYQPDAAELSVLTEVERVFPLLRLTAFDVSRQRTSRAGRQTAMLVRYGLLKRLESSTYAFRASLLRLLRFLDAFADAVAGGGYVRPVDVRVVDPLQLSLSTLVSRPLPRGVGGARLAEDVAHDCALLRELLSILPSRPPAKLRALNDLLGTLGDAKAVVFTEFSETAEALFGALPQSGTALLHGTGARVASGSAGRRVVLEHFAPLACSVAPPPAHQRIHTLIATDVLAEGIDLQDANHCISYDLPWNPVRLMQRAGRIDRLGSPHSDVFVWYFEPRREIERWIGLMRRLGIKLRTISSSVGAEHGAILDSGNAAIENLSTGVTLNVQQAIPSGVDESEATLRDTLAAMLRRCSRDAVDAVAAVQRDRGHHWPRATAIALNDHEFAALVAIADASAARTFLGDQNRAAFWLRLSVHERAGTSWVECTAEIAGRRIGCEPSQTTAVVKCLGEFLMQAAYKTVDEPLSLIRDTGEYDPATPADGGCGGSGLRRIADALIAPMARDPAASDPECCARADRILEQLKSGVRVGIAREITSALTATNLRDLLDRLEAVLDPRSRAADHLVTVLLVIATENDPGVPPECHTRQPSTGIATA